MIGNRVSETVVSRETKFWDPGCSRPPQIFDAETERFDSKEVATTYRRSTEWIDDTQNLRSKKPPRIRPMGFCHHVTSETQIESAFLRLTAQIEAVPEERDYEGCDDTQWILETRVQDVALTLRSEELALGCLGDVGYSYDPYLLTHHVSFRTKLAQLDQIALKKVISSLDDGFSMPVFLFELIELKSLWKHMASLVLFSQIKKSLRAAGKAPLKELSNHFLATIFGWLPFLRDIQTIVSKFMTVADKVNDFVLNQGKRRTFHVGKQLSPLTFRPEEWFESTLSAHSAYAGNHYAPWWFANDYFNVIEFSTKTMRSVSNCSYHLTLDYQYDLPGVNAAVQSFKAELDHWGINLSVSDVWQVIPFSFVVDWVWNVGQWLEQFDFVNCPPAIVIHDCCRSIRYELTEASEFYELTFLSGPSPITSVPVSEIQATPGSLSVKRKTEGYYREPGPPLPAPEDLPGFRTPSGMQWLIAMALLRQYRG